MRFAEPDTLERHPATTNFMGADLAAVTSQDENHYFIPDFSAIPLVAHGKFRGVPDTRGRRCIYWSCQAQGAAGCNYCRALPYVSSTLRQVTARPDLASAAADLPFLRSISSLSVDARLGNLLDELSRLQQDAAESMDRHGSINEHGQENGHENGLENGHENENENISENINTTTSNSIRPWPLGALPLARARERITRIRHRLWAREDLLQLEGFFLRRSMRTIHKGLLTPRRPASLSNSA